VIRVLMTIAMWGLALLAMAALFVYGETSQVTFHGFDEVNEVGVVRRPLILAMGCIIGILSKALYDELLVARVAPVGLLGVIRDGLAPLT
jgi:hypothetical protein